MCAQRDCSTSTRADRIEVGHEMRLDGNCCCLQFSENRHSQRLVRTGVGRHQEGDGTPEKLIGIATGLPHSELAKVG